MEANNDELNGIKFTWNVFPSNRTDVASITIPLGFHYSPNKKTEALQVLEYDPVICSQCKSVLNPHFQVNFKSKTWECAFCKSKVGFPSMYAQFISETNLPAELLPESSSVEYKLNKPESNWPIFIFLIDVAVEEEELNELKDSIQQVIATIPKECSVGIITFGNMCNVHEIGFSEFPVSHSFKGEKSYTNIEIQEQLGLANVTNKAVVPITNGHSSFIVPLTESEFIVNTFLDELQPDMWVKKQGERHARCSGLALHVAMSLLECVPHSDPARILTFLGGACSIGPGQIVGKPLVETIRNYVDFEKSNPNTKYFKPATDFYKSISTRASRSGHIIDVFSCSLNQVGLYEMRHCVEQTGGYMILTDSFSTMLFKDSFKKIFELDENNNLKMNFRAKIDVNTTNPVKLSGALGHLVSLENKGKNVSEIVIGEGGTKSWALGGMDSNSTYTFILDLNNSVPNTPLPRHCHLQIMTSYIAGDRSHRLRVTTVVKKLLPEINSPNSKNEISQSFDQEAAVVMIARLSIFKGFTEDHRDILKWVDKLLIKVTSKFCHKDDHRGLKFPPNFGLFPQFVYYLRRSHFIQNFNASPDEVQFYKTVLMHENVINSTIMIQPFLVAYTPDNPDSSPVFLDVESMKNDNVLLLDAFFFVVIWHGEDVCKWRDAGYHNDPEYENIKMMLDNPQEYAQSIILDRLPVSRFVSCDSGSGQERLLKCVVNPSGKGGNKNKVIEDGFVSDDVSLKVFLDFLIKLARES
jgi:protein transport protein SEC23